MSAVEIILEAIETGENELVIEDKDITDLPEELWQLENLTSLELKNCFNLETISANISKLINLKSFRIVRTRISSFPAEFGQLVNLRSLEILACPYFETLPSEIGLLTNLSSLSIIGCENLKFLPDEIGKLINLKSIRIINCEKIKIPSVVYSLPNIVFWETADSCKIQKDAFPQSIPIDLQRELQVINEKGETIALFFGPDLLKVSNKFSSLEEFCTAYDQLYDDYCNWDNAGINLSNQSPEEQAEDYRKVLQNLKWDTYIFMRIKAKGYNFLLQKLSRLAYSYCCEVNEIEKSLTTMNKKINYYYVNDINILRTACHYDMVELNFLMQEIIKKGWVYEHPEFWFTNKNIGAALAYSIENKNTELIGFLLDYKNKHFPATGTATMEIKVDE